MRAVIIENPGTHSRLVIDDVDLPSCDTEQVLIKVYAAAINRADLLQREGKYPAPLGESTIPGLEVAGEIIALGDKVTRFKIGDRIYGLVGSGGYAEYCCVHQHLAELIPSPWSFAYAAAIPEALMTSQATLVNLGQLTPGQTLLIHAASSGIASFAIQMAKQIGAHVITTASTPSKVDKARQLGADTIINYQETDFEMVIAEQSIDLIVDYLGGDYFNKHLRLLKPQGKLIQIATLQGHKVECNLAVIMRKRLQINGFVLRSQSITEKIALWQSAQQQWATHLLAQTIQPIIDSEFDFSAIAKAQAHMQNRTHFGKIVINCNK